MDSCQETLLAWLAYRATRAVPDQSDQVQPDCPGSVRAENLPHRGPHGSSGGIAWRAEGKTCRPDGAAGRLGPVGSGAAGLPGQCKG